LIEPLPYQDYTAKAVLRHWEEVENKIHALQATRIGTDFQHDTYFYVSKGKLKWRKGTLENLITHYERIIDGDLERTLVYRYDWQPSWETIQKLLNTHVKIGEVIKERTIYRWQHLKIHLDKLIPHGFFIEVEAIDRTNSYTAAELKIACENLLAQLEITSEDRIRTGYLS
jgi:predicted adenylyl cyclase CyaB